jgi:phage terminase small subunit
LSSKKKNTNPTNSAKNKSRAPDWLSNASGSKCMKAVAIKAPAAMLSMCWV